MLLFCFGGVFALLLLLYYQADFSKNPKWVLLHSENYTGTDKRYLPTNYGQAESSEWKGMRYSTWNPNDPTNDTDVETMRNERTQQPRITS